MCGEIDDHVEVGQDLQEHLRILARMMDLRADEGAAPSGLAEAEGRGAYMDAVFRDGLSRAMGAVAAADEDEAVDALAAQAIALARLAGFLAGQLPPEADLFRATVEALTAGHSEPRAMTEAHRRDHHHHHHDHDHGHTH